MKKQLFLIRHAKSSWANPMQSDFDRPLNERGEHDAPLIGKRLKSLGFVPDAIIASAAKRTKQTAKHLAKATDFDKEKIELQERIYHCESEMLQRVVTEIDSKVDTAFIVAHNPGITHFVNTLSELFSIDDMPTCGVVGVRFEAAEWADFGTTKKEVFLFEYPKKL
ncbi:MAG TPA: histidine phosphatase family protein [Flavipsychrobacter sp.]|nr:histidine phosphatase family protein [Flavipsychrobacter sp.]